MKIAVIVSRITRLAPVMVIRSVVNSLAGIKDINIHIYYLDAVADDSIEWKVPVLHLDSSFRFSDYDIIHTTGIRPDFLAYRNRKAIKYQISTVNSFIREELRCRYNFVLAAIVSFLWMRVWKKADKLVCVSGSLKSYYTKWFDASRLAVVYNGVPAGQGSGTFDDDITIKVSEFRKGGYVIAGTIAKLSGVKAVDRILRMVQSEKSLALVVIGDGGKYGSLLKLSQTLNIAERVIFTGFRNDATKYLKYFDVYINTSITEGYSLSVMEAVSRKVPVVCPGIPVFRELFSEEEVNFFNPADEKSLLRTVMTAVLKGKQKLQAAYEKYLDKFTEDKMAAGYLKLYSEACPA